MNVAFVIDVLLKAGGGNSATYAEYKLARSINEKNLEIKFITTSKDTKKILENKFNDSISYYNKNSILSRFFLFLYQSEFFRFLIKRLKIINPFEKYLNKLGVDLLIFLAPSDLIFFLTKSNFVYTVWEFQHKNYPFFPEYKNVFFDIDARDKTLKLAADKSFKIIVGTKKSKDDFIKFYPCDQNKIIFRPLKPSIVDVNQSSKDLDIIKKLKSKQINKFLFYPAQYWAHKNHKYIIDAFDKISNSVNSNLACVFAGSDKGNLKYIKKLIESKKLTNRIHVFEFLSDEEIVDLYKNCFAVIVPTLVGTISFPILEGFYFKKPVLSGVDNLDQNFKDKVINLDLKNPDRLEEALIFMEKNPEQIRNIVLNSKTYFDETYSDENLTFKLLKIIKEYQYYRQMW